MSPFAWFKKLPLRQQFWLAGAAAGGLALALGSWALANWAQTALHRETHRELAALAATVGPVAADRMDLFSTLQSNPGLVAAASYNARGELIAHFHRPGTEPLPQRTIGGEGFSAERLELVSPVRRSSGAPLITLVLRADPARTQAYQREALLFLLGAGVLAMVLPLVAVSWLERQASQTLQNLAKTAGQVQKEENFNLRATGGGSAELDRLVNALNEMLAHLQLRDLDLRRHRDHLGELIAQGTAELMQANQALFDAQNQAEEGSRVKNAFLTRMSHELRTPINAIKGYSEILMEGAEAADRTEDLADLQRIHGAGMRLLGLIDELLDLSKIEAGKMTLHYSDFDLMAVVRQVFDDVRPRTAKSGSRLELDAPAEAIQVRADQTKVRQVLLNLLGNAVKFTIGGEVRMRISQAVKEAHPWITIAVSDTGIGMTQEQMTRLFQPFSQGDPSIAQKFGGTGLGLAISRQFVEALGGTLTVTSELARGSTFTVWLPAQPLRLPDSVTKAPRAAPSAPASRPQAPVVLVIDDDLHTRDLMLRFLKKEGFTAHATADGHSGLELARRLRPALITLDVIMPGTDGWMVLSALKADPVLAEIPVVMVTMTEDRDRGFTLGASEFLTKPVNFPHLANLLREYCPSPDDRPVLVVDDDELERHLLRRNLEKEGFPVLTATDGRAALDLLRTRKPCVILLDLVMPEMDGFAFALAVRERRDLREVPILVLTAKDITPEDRQRLSGNVACVLQKQTLTMETLQTQLRDVLARHAAPSTLDAPPPAA